MRRIGILTAGGDTPALNATIFGAVERANLRRVEVFGILDGFVGLLDSRLPHVPLNPLFSTIPELDPKTRIESSRQPGRLRSRAARGPSLLADELAMVEHRAVASG